MSRAIYEVRASAGYYEDHRDWLVAAYSGRKDAEAHRAAAEQEATRLIEWSREGENWEYIGEPEDPRNAYDSEPSSWRDHPTYYVTAVEVREGRFRRARPAALPTTKLPGGALPEGEGGGDGA